MSRYICIHGHFYQPPREHAWLEEVELQDSAYPYHDWNDRIAAECYAPNTASRILDPEAYIVEILNNYSKISFNFGPTLLYWMERNRPDVYAAVLEADRLSRERFSGHGSALAQVYNHMIMPLANKRDKVTQALWGIRDFERRFGRFPEGIWLPETAVDLDTLEVLAELGIKFTILAPNQAKRVKKIGRGRWVDVSGSKIDPTRPYLCRLPSGGSINLFFYDGPVSRAIAFEGLLSSGDALCHRLHSAFSDGRTWPQMIHIATDGESYGHHHRHGDMALAYCLNAIEHSGRINGTASLTNYGEYLERHPPTHLVEIHENSSWSCAHGVERWRADCGCNSGMRPGWRQAWRGPLREALDWLRNQLAGVFGRETDRFFPDAWQARNEYVRVVNDRSPENVRAFLSEQARRELSKEESVAALKLLEMQRHAMFMYTSCGWFFDEISGIETVQIMQYAARAIQLAEGFNGRSLEPEFVELLKKAPSNVYENGAEPYELFVRPARVDLLRVGAHYAIASVFEPFSEQKPEQARIYCYAADSEAHERYEAGKFRLVLGRVRITSEVTWEEGTYSYAVLHLGEHHVNGGIRPYQGPEAFGQMQQEVRAAFEKADAAEVIRLLGQHFGEHTYTLWHLFRDEQRKVLDQVLAITQEDIAAEFRTLYGRHYPLMTFLKELRIPLSDGLRVTAEFIINHDLRGVLEAPDPDLDRLAKLVQEAGQWAVQVDTETLEYLVRLRVHTLFERFGEKPEDIAPLEAVDRLMGVLEPLHIDMDPWKSQNICFSIGKSFYYQMKARAQGGDAQAAHWVEVFKKVAARLKVRVE